MAYYKVTVETPYVGTKNEEYVECSKDDIEIIANEICDDNAESFEYLVFNEIEIEDEDDYYANGMNEEVEYILNEYYENCGYGYEEVTKEEYLENC